MKLIDGTHNISNTKRAARDNEKASNNNGSNRGRGWIPWRIIPSSTRTTTTTAFGCR